VARRIGAEADLVSAHAVFVEAFRDEWGYHPDPFEEWRALEVEIPSFDPSLWLIATEGERVVGALNAIVWGDRGWIGELGVRRAWRGRGIASAMLRRSFATFAERGLPRVLLNVDFDNPTGAVALYEKVGMRGELVVGAGGRPETGTEAAGKRLWEGIGAVVSTDLRKSRIVVDHEEIPGFMAAMTMSYAVTRPEILPRLQPGDRIRFIIDAEQRAIVDITPVPK